MVEIKFDTIEDFKEFMEWMKGGNREEDKFLDLDIEMNAVNDKEYYCVHGCPTLEIRKEMGFECSDFDYCNDCWKLCLECYFRNIFNCDFWNVEVSNV